MPATIAPPKEIARLARNWRAYRASLGENWTPSYYFTGGPQGLYAFPSSQWSLETQSPLHTAPGQQGEIDPFSGRAGGGLPVPDDPSQLPEWQDPAFQQAFKEWQLRTALSYAGSSQGDDPSGFFGGGIVGRYIFPAIAAGAIGYGAYGASALGAAGEASEGALAGPFGLDTTEIGAGEALGGIGGTEAGIAGGVGTTGAGVGELLQGPTASGATLDTAAGSTAAGAAPAGGGLTLSQAAKAGSLASTLAKLGTGLLGGAAGAAVGRGSPGTSPDTQGTEDILEQGRQLAQGGVPLQLGNLLDSITKLRARAAGSTAELFPSLQGQLDQMRQQYAGATQALNRRLGFSGAPQAERGKAALLSQASKQYGGLISQGQQGGFAQLVQTLGGIQPVLSGQARPPSTSQNVGPVDMTQFGQGLSSLVSTAQQIQNYMNSRSTVTPEQATSTIAGFRANPAFQTGLPDYMTNEAGFIT